MLTQPDWQAMYQAQEADLQRFRAHAERARWCEENDTDVIYSDCERLWWVQWLDQEGTFREVSDPDRNAAIDLARGAK